MNTYEHNGPYLSLSIIKYVVPTLTKQIIVHLSNKQMSEPCVMEKKTMVTISMQQVLIQHVNSNV